MRYINKLIDQLPGLQAVLSVYAVVVFLIYSWTLFASFYILPSWIYYLDIPQIISVYAYSFVFDFIESISVLLAMLLLEFLLTGVLRMGKDGFCSRSIVLLLVITTASVIRLFDFMGYDEMTGFVNGQGAWWLWTFSLGAFLVVVVPRIYWAKSFLDSLANHAVIFLYVYLPISLVSLVIVVVRNIL